MFIRLAARSVAMVGYVCMGLFYVSLVFASGSKPLVPVPAALNSAEVRIATEVVPAGGTAQIKFSLTNPQPILTGGTGFNVMQLDGVSLWSPSGDAAGAAVVHDGRLYVSAISPSGDLGMAEYPFLTVTMNLPSSLKDGTVFPLTMASDTALVTATGQLAITVKPATLTVGGNFSIHGVTPGGGTWPAGTTIRIDGQGFLPGAQLRTPQMKFSSFNVVNSTEIDFTLKEQTTLDAQPVQVVSGGFTQTYYSYLRGIPVRDPSRMLLKNTDPIFQQQTHALAQAGPFPAQNAGQYIALALQNPNPGPAVATLKMIHSDGTSSEAMIVLPSGTRMMDDVAALLNLSAIQAGDQLSLVATSPIQILGMAADENLGIVIPFLPSF